MGEFESFEIELANGKIITGIINGNNYITTEEVTQADVSDTNLIGATNNGRPMGQNLSCNLWEQNDGIHMVFRWKSYDEIQREILNAKLEYIAMMTDVDL